MRLAHALVHHIGNNAAYRGNERGVDGFIKRVGTGVGYLRRNAARFLVHVIFKLRLGEIAREERGYVIAEVGGNDERRIGLARVHLFHGGVFVGERPT